MEVVGHPYWVKQSSVCLVTCEARSIITCHYIWKCVWIRRILILDKKSFQIGSTTPRQFSADTLSNRLNHSETVFRGHTLETKMFTGMRVFVANSRIAKIMQLKIDSLATRTGRSSVIFTITLMVLSLSAWIIFLTGFAMRNHWTVAELDNTFEHEFFCWWGLVFSVPISCLVLLLYSYCCHVLLGVLYFLLAQLSLVFSGGVVNINAQRIIGFYNVQEDDEYFNKFVVLEFSAAIIFIIFQMMLLLVQFLFLFRGLNKLSNYVHYSQFGRDLHYNPIDD